MHSASYEITALISRYFLVLLCLVVFVRTIFISRAQRPKSGLSASEPIAFITLVDNNKTYGLGLDNIIGSSKRCDVKVAGRNVGNIHAQIYKIKNQWMLCVYSNKPTYLNDIKVSGKQVINTNDIIRLGSLRFKFEANEGVK